MRNYFIGGLFFVSLLLAAGSFAVSSAQVVADSGPEEGKLLKPRVLPDPNNGSGVINEPENTSGNQSNKKDLLSRFRVAHPGFGIDSIDVGNRINAIGVQSSAPSFSSSGGGIDVHVNTPMDCVDNENVSSSLHASVNHKIAKMPDQSPQGTALLKTADERGFMDPKSAKMHEICYGMNEMAKKQAAPGFDLERFRLNCLAYLVVTNPLENNFHHEDSVSSAAKIVDKDEPADEMLKAMSDLPESYAKQVGISTLCQASKGYERTEALAVFCGQHEGVGQFKGGTLS